jgi:GR25 family glycosyltransferase involved in LPS biosynthesis
MNFQTPILIIGWRRPEHIKEVIDAVRNVLPTKIFVAVDGPRLGDEFEEERRLIEQTKAVIEKEIDWDCELKLNYQKHNLGCRVAVSTAITWFFEQVENGIILEDDCVPSDDFFRFASEMLDKYRENNRIMHITGSNFNRGRNFNKNSYYFSIYNHMWGWATWKRAWKQYDFNESYWVELKSINFLYRYLNSNIEAKFWTKYFEEIFVHKTLDTWDYVWRLNIWTNNGLTITPNVNLVTNIGFDELATHGKNGSSTPIDVLKFPLLHPTKIQANHRTDQWTFKKQIAEKYVMKHSFKNKIRLKLKTLLKV